ELREAADEVDAYETIARADHCAAMVEIAEVCRWNALEAIRHAADALNGAAVLARAKRARRRGGQKGGSI
ncbi:MAG TPA: hypothetical protein VK841_07490, partial [Polyangiaceae bacterium]|nr:hypothetical protein [Polyangiaceae bacterium]